MILTDTLTNAFDEVSLDIVIHLPQNSQNLWYLLTMQDHLTKLSVVAPLETADFRSIAYAFTKHFITKYGCPKLILTDQGKNFMSHLMKDFAKLFKITKYNTSA